jgi:sugar O-acyltransferase (sialic acid O-acetyltransferase NeuD family)
MGSRRFAIFGAGGFGRELVKPAQEMLAARHVTLGVSSELVFVSDQPDGEVLGVPHLPVDALHEDDEFVVAIGDSHTRRRISERLRATPSKLRAATAVIGPNATIKEGAVFCDFTMVTASARIGLHFQCNIYSYVAHDCVIGDYVTFAPKVCCNGNVHIGDGAYIGTGAILRQGTPEAPLIIGEGAVVGMGAVVTKNVPPGAVVVGNPARPLPPK